jgi:hypothetical protein
MSITFPRKSGELPHRVEMFEQWSARFPQTNTAMASAIAACTKGYKEFREQNERLARDETVTAGARVVRGAKAARAKLIPLLEGLETAMQNADVFAAQMEMQTIAAYSPPQNPPYTTVNRHLEIRTYLRTLPSGEKLQLIEQARKAGDEDTLIAIASVQPFLSAVDGQVQKMVRDQLIETKAPEQAKALREVRDQQRLAAQFKGTMLQSVSDLIDFNKADELIATAQEDVAAA